MVLGVPPCHSRAEFHPFQDLSCRLCRNGVVIPRVLKKSVLFPNISAHYLSFIPKLPLFCKLSSSHLSLRRQLRIWSWRDGSAGKSIGCSCRGPGFSSQRPQGRSQPSTTVTPSDFTGQHVVCPHTCRQNMCINANKVSKCKNKVSKSKNIYIF